MGKFDVTIIIVRKVKYLYFKDPEKPGQKPYTQEYQVDLNEYKTFSDRIKTFYS